MSFRPWIFSILRMILVSYDAFGVPAHLQTRACAHAHRKKTHQNTALQRHIFYFNRTLLPRKPLITLKCNGCLFFKQFALSLYTVFVPKDFLWCRQEIQIDYISRDVGMASGRGEKPKPIFTIFDVVGTLTTWIVMKWRTIFATKMAFIHCLIWCICAILSAWNDRKWTSCTRIHCAHMLCVDFQEWKLHSVYVSNSDLI